MGYMDEVHIRFLIDLLVLKRMFPQVLLANGWVIVGFTGSGQPMRKDATRGKHIYQHGEEEE